MVADLRKQTPSLTIHANVEVARSTKNAADNKIGINPNTTPFFYSNFYTIDGGKQQF